MTVSDLITTQEAADLLGIDRSTLSRWVSHGWIEPAMRVSPRGTMLFSRRRIEKYARARNKASA